MILVSRFLFKAFASIMIAGITTAGALASELPDEDLHYSIMYKWGLINKEAGRATLSLRNYPGRYKAMLAARTVPWADKVYRVRDTLKSEMASPSCLPSMYVKLTHEGSANNVDRLCYSRNGNEVTVYSHRERSKNNGPVTVSDTVLHGTPPGLDMLSVFYYMRRLDFQSMKPGETVVLDLFSGRKVERLTISYNGRRTIKLNSGTRHTYEVTFSFTQNGKTSDAPMYTWISTDSARIPLKMEGQLPFGKVQAFYTGSNRQ